MKPTSSSRPHPTRRSGSSASAPAASSPAWRAAASRGPRAGRRSPVVLARPLGSMAIVSEPRAHHLKLIQTASRAARSPRRAAPARAPRPARRPRALRARPRRPRRSLSLELSSPRRRCRRRARGFGRWAAGTWLAANCRCQRMGVERLLPGLRDRNLFARCKRVSVKSVVRVHRTDALGAACFRCFAWPALASVLATLASLSCAQPQTRLRGHLPAF